MSLDGTRIGGVIGSGWLVWREAGAKRARAKPGVVKGEHQPRLSLGIYSRPGWATKEKDEEKQKEDQVQMPVPPQKMIHKSIDLFT
jgi:hypothetical protein